MNIALPISPVRSAVVASALVCALALSACGGGGGGGSSPSPAAASVTLTGTAAAAAAIANAPVDVKCAGGVTLAGVVTTAANGAYSASISGATFPCVVRVTNGGDVLHSVVAGGSGTVTANVTPVTELVTANVAGSGTVPEALYATFDATAQAKVTPSTVSTAVATVTAALAGTVDLTGTDPIGGTLVAANGSTVANSLGAQAAALTTALADAGLALAALDGAVSIATTTTAPLVHALATQAASCSALRSGTYRVIDPSSAAQDPGYAAYRVKLDATALTATDVEPGHAADVTTLAPVAASPCSYTYAGDYGTATLLVSTGGLMVGRSPASNGQLRVLFLIPEQVIPLSRLAGTWNFMDYSGDDNDQPPLTSVYGTRVLDATGNFSSGINCTGTSCGAASNASAHLRVDPAGGYGAGSDGSRAFALIADDGSMALFGFDGAGGSLEVLAMQKPLSLPAANDVLRFWDFIVGNGNFTENPAPGASDLSDFAITVTAVDMAAKTYTRVRSSDGRVDSIISDTPFNGLRVRPVSDAAAATVYLPLPGTGLTFYMSHADSATDFFGISVSHP